MTVFILLYNKTQIKLSISFITVGTDNWLNLKTLLVFLVTKKTKAYKEFDFGT